MKSRKKSPVKSLLKVSFLLAFIGSIFCFGAWSGFKTYTSLGKKGCLNGESANIQLPKLAERGNIKFIAIGDVGTEDQNQILVADSVNRVCRSVVCDFILLLGDNFYPAGVSSIDDPRFNEGFEKLYGPSNVPVFSVLGNHDVKGNAEAQKNYSLVSNYWKMPNYNYYFKAGPAFFYALNSNCSLLSWKDLFNKVKSSDADWKIIFAHHTLYSSGKHGDADIISRGLWQTFFQDQVSFFISGHDHHLEYLKVKGQKTEYVISGAGGKSYIAENQGTKHFGKSKATSVFQYSDNGFVLIEIINNQAKIDYFDKNGTILKSFQREKLKSNLKAESKI